MPSAAPRAARRWKWSRASDNVHAPNRHGDVIAALLSMPAPADAGEINAFISTAIKAVTD